ncbi:MAG TPA: hypothetical protein VHN20_17100 [Beijerinckiaceae bacterium]|nr:hypothetical protein [Beijerinckiaceae bacterium]
MRPPLLCIIATLAGALATPAAAEEPRHQLMTDRPAQAQWHGPDCICRAQGRTFAVGQNACLQTPAGPRVAECGMVLNNTSWRVTELPCPET